MMTDANLPTGSERVATVAKHFPEMDIIINLQGDEPFIKPKMLETLVAPYLAGETPSMTTLAYPLDMRHKFNDPGTVKVILDQTGHAIYFSRSSIPYFKTSLDAPVYNHMGLYAFRRDFLLHFQTLKQTPLELCESLEQLRVIEHGHRIRVCLTTDRTLEINNKEEYDEAQTFEYVI
jgi:3-deoxy-manno-octulosonate cytidylyltransferase (CMP-KDO synthetase)